ncbi:MAG: hypothetical protein M3Y27_06435 [Acidobacteriota bacterium]|nr:hypothetical protein [Acidobacteriota bacterium]
MRLSFSIKAFSVATALLLTCAPSRAQSANELIENGDVFALKFQSDEALKDYLAAEKLEPKNVRLLVRISREYRHLMSDASSTEEKLRLGGIAVDYAKRAAALGPNNPEAQLAVAISYGKLQPLVGTKEKLQTARIIKSEADKAIKLDPRSDLAWHVLGRWNKGFAEITTVKRTLAEMLYGKLPVTTYEDAAKCFEKAIELKPERLIHYIELGEVYSRMGRTADARRVITQGLAMKQTEKDDPEAKQRGRETLAKLR